MSMLIRFMHLFMQLARLAPISHASEALAWSVRGGAGCAIGFGNRLGFVGSPMGLGGVPRERRVAASRVKWGAASMREPRRGKTPFRGGRAGGREGNLDPARTDFHQSADLQQFQPDCAAGGGGNLCVSEANPAEGAEEAVGHRGKPQTQLLWWCKSPSRLSPRAVASSRTMHSLRSQGTSDRNEAKLSAISPDR